MRLEKLKRRIWKSGGNYVTSLPRSWAENIVKNYNSEVEGILLQDKFILTVPYEKARKKYVRVDSIEDKYKLKMDVVTSYLRGFDGVEFPETSVSKEFIQYLYFTIPGMKGPELTPQKNFRISFFPVYDVSLKENYSNLKTIINELKNVTKDAFKAFPSLTEINKSKIYVENLEHQLDMMTYHVRKYLNLALSYADIFERTELKSDEDVIYVTSLFGYFERLGDLHKEVVERIEKIANTEFSKHGNLTKFLSHYELTTKYIDDTINSLGENRASSLKVIREVMEKKAKKGLLYQREEELQKFIESLNTTPNIIRHLTILEGKLRAIPDICANICEVVYNLSMTK
jgi:phosphate uptake regulator